MRLVRNSCFCSSRSTWVHSSHIFSLRYAPSDFFWILTRVFLISFTWASFSLLSLSVPIPSWPLSLTPIFASTTSPVVAWSITLFPCCTASLVILSTEASISSQILSRFLASVSLISSPVSLSLESSWESWSLIFWAMRLDLQVVLHPLQLWDKNLLTCVLLLLLWRECLCSQCLRRKSLILNGPVNDDLFLDLMRLTLLVSMNLWVVVNRLFLKYKAPLEMNATSKTPPDRQCSPFYLCHRTCLVFHLLN